MKERKTFFSVDLLMVPFYKASIVKEKWKSGKCNIQYHKEYINKRQTANAKKSNNSNVCLIPTIKLKITCVVLCRCILLAQIAGEGEEKLEELCKEDHRGGVVAVPLHPLPGPGHYPHKYCFRCLQVLSHETDVDGGNMEKRTFKDAPSQI